MAPQKRNRAKRNQRPMASTQRGSQGQRRTRGDRSEPFARVLDGEMRLVEAIPSAFPNEMKTMLRYGTQVTFGHGSGLTGYNVYNCASLYDFDVTGTGHQPRWYDQIVGSNAFTTYRVDKFDYLVEFLTPAAEIDTCLIQFSTTAPSNQTTGETLMQQSELSFTQRGESSQQRRLTLQGSVSLSKVIGISEEEYRLDGAYRGLYNANPAQPVYMTVSNNPTFGTTDSKANVFVRFHVSFYDRAQLVGPS